MAGTGLIRGVAAADGHPPAAHAPSIADVLRGSGVEHAGPPWDIPEFPRALPDGHPLLRPTIEIDTPERHQFRQDLIAETIGDAQPPAEGRPVLHLMGGGGASGKGAVLAQLIEEGRVPRDGVVHLDPDQLKASIPEYGEIVRAGDSRAAAVVHEESSTVAKAVLREAMRRRLNMVYDVTLGDPVKGIDLIRQAHDAGYEVRLYGVTADAGTAVVRNASRAARTGRYVPVDMQLRAHRGFSEGFERYAELADQVQLFDTNSTENLVIAAKPAGGSLEVLDRQRYKAFLHKADINPHAQGPEELYRTGERAAGASTPAAGQRPEPG